MARTLRLIPGGAAEGKANADPIAGEADLKSSAEVPVSPLPRAEPSSAAAGEPASREQSAPAAPAVPFATAPTANTSTFPQSGQGAAAAFPTDTVPNLRFGERPLGPNDKVDRYIIERLIAAGGMARVYRAHHEWARRPVALKVLRTRYAGRPDLIDRFQKEAMALGQIKHPNVVTLENGGLTATGEVFIAMEFLEGKTLRDVLQERGTLPIREAISIVLQVAHGVAAAHDVNVVHRDIKPENIFCTTFGTVKVLDLGLAKIIGFDSKETDPEGLIGTAAYMAPEQLDGLPADARSDVYALGLVAYECLAGFHPLVPDGVWPSRNEIALRQLSYEPPTLRQLPRPVWQAIAKATHKNPAYRFSSMEEFAAALHKLRHDLTASLASNPGATPAPSKSALSRTLASPAVAESSSPVHHLVRRYPMIIGAAVGLTTAAALFVWRSHHSSTPEPTAAPAVPVATAAAPVPMPNATEAPAMIPKPTAAAPATATAAPSPRSPSAQAIELAPKPRSSSPEDSRSQRPSAAPKERKERPKPSSPERMPSSGL